MKTQVLVINDIIGHSQIVDIEQGRDETIDHLKYIVNDIQQSEQELIQACLHIADQMIVLRFWSFDINFARDLCNTGSIPHRAIEMLKTGSKVWVL